LHWIAEEITGLSLKTETNERGQFYEQNIYARFADVGRYVLLNYDAVDDWRLRENATHTATLVVDSVKEQLDSAKSSVRSSFLKTLNIERKRLGGPDFLKAVRASGKNLSHTQIAGAVFAEIIPTATLFSQTLAHVVNYFLDADRKEARENIVKLANSQEKDVLPRLMAYIYEALRIDPPVSAVYRTAAKDINTPHIDFKASERIFVNISAANSDESEFGPPPAASFSRPQDKSGIMAFEHQGILSPAFLEVVAPPILKAIFSLPTLQRGPGQSGHLTRFQEQWDHGSRQQYINGRGRVVPWPDSLVIQYEPREVNGTSS